jgi:ribosomal protein S13
MARLRVPALPQASHDPEVTSLVRDITNRLKKLDNQEITKLQRDIADLEFTLKDLRDEVSPGETLKGLFEAGQWKLIQKYRRTAIFDKKTTNKARAAREARTFCREDGRITFDELVGEFGATNTRSRVFTSMLRKFQREGCDYETILRQSRPFALQRQVSANRQRKCSWQRADLERGYEQWKSQRQALLAAAMKKSSVSHHPLTARTVPRLQRNLSIRSILKIGSESGSLSNAIALLP